MNENSEVCHEKKLGGGKKDADKLLKVAIIIPIYNVEHTLVENCINSVIVQTYKEIEIVLVDDGNDKDYAEFIEKFKRIDNRISVYRHEQNQGLYQARMSGVKHSNSDYIAFVDADDTISIDWIRILVKKAVENHSDIVMGRTICVNEDGCKYIFNSNYSVCTHEAIKGKEIFEFLIKDCGLDFSMHTVWNKLYSRALWEKAWGDLSSHGRHLIMTEDILFSCILFYHAQRMSFSNHDGYFYFRNIQSSTINTGTISKCRKDIEDLSYVFHSVKNFMKKQRGWEQYKCFYNEWLNRYFRWWSMSVEKICKVGGTEADHLKTDFLEHFDKQDFEFVKDEDNYFIQKKTVWNPALENIKKAIASEECRIVSFDLFDTLIVRPVLYPEDVYEIVLSEINIFPYDTNVIAEYRKLAEKYARADINRSFPQYEDITLTEIYKVMSERYGIDKKLCEKLKKKEIELEIEFAIKRQTGAELFELAAMLHKKIYIISDMYLEMTDIKRILHKNGYDGYIKLYLSSQERLLKSTGNLYDIFLMETGQKESNVIHIGDNWQSDVVIPAQKGVKTFFLPKTKDILFNYLGNIYTGNSIGTAIDNKGSIIDYSGYFRSLAVRCMYAVASNIMFDDPYVSFNRDSDYNGDPYFLGCVPVGMHMFGISWWLLGKVMHLGYDKVHFSSRDGFYIKKIYDLMYNKLTGTFLKSNYLYVSRKSLIPVEICKNDFVDRILTSCSFSVNTPRSIINRYHAVLKPLTGELIEIYKESGFLMDKCFQNEDEFAVFIKELKAHQYSEAKAKENFETCKNYLIENIGSNDLIFDLGYSGKLHQYMVEALGQDVAGVYVYKDGYNAIRRIEDKSLTIYSYYDFVPSMGGIVNEYIVSDRSPSCVGYFKEGSNIRPVFEEKNDDYIGDYVINEINRGAFRFTEEFLKYFGKRMNNIKLQPLDASLLYESFLVKPKQFDQSIFDYCVIEDEFWGGIKRGFLHEIWEYQREDKKLKISHSVQQIQENDNLRENLEYEVYLKNIHNRNLFFKGLYWFCVDREFFKKRFSEHIHKQKKEGDKSGVKRYGKH